MRIIVTVASLLWIALVLVDCFQAMVLPRRVNWPYRPTRLFYRATWTLWRAAAGLLPAGRRRETFLSIFGPLSMLTLFVTWMLGLIVGFAGLHWSLRTALNPPEQIGFLTYFYWSGNTFFTLGYGDVTPTEVPGRMLAVAEAGLGLGFLALVIGYLPVLYQAFSRRELTISLLDARAGSPPTAAELLLRLAQAHSMEAVLPFLAEWERWAAELLESHLSFPVLSYYRSQHDNQSWLATLTVILDACAFLIAGVKNAPRYHAELTFAMARHAAVDLSMVFKAPPRTPDPDRLPGPRLAQVRALLREAGLLIPEDPGTEARLIELRGMYEPFINGLATYFVYPVPPVLRDVVTVDNWQTSAWMRRVPGFGKLPLADGRDDHFD